MYSSLLSLTMFLLKENNSWVTESSWECLNAVSNKYFTSNSLVILSDTETEKLDIGFKTTFRTSKQVPVKREKIEVAFIIKKFEKWLGDDVHGKVILLTESLNNISSLWTNFRLVDLIVILQNVDKCEIYLWFPYKPESCGSVNLELVDTWKGGKFEQNSDLLVKRIPKKFEGCVLNISFSECPPFIMVAPNQTRIGPEIKILNALVRQLDMKFVQLNFPYQMYYRYANSNGSYSGAYKLLNDRTVDIAASCLSIDKGVKNFDFLPSHYQDVSTWLLPGPAPKQIAYGFITALSSELWIAIGILYVLVFCFASIAAPSQTLAQNFTWVTERFLSMPNSPLGRNFNLRSFSYLLEITILVISTIYKSLILLQLCRIPMLIFSTASIGLDHGLKAYIRPSDQDHLNHTDYSFWNRLLVPGKYEFPRMFDYNLLLYNRSGMFLGRTVVDQAMIRLTYPDVNYKASVLVQKDYLLTIDVAFILPAHYPLTKLFSGKLLNIIQAGLPQLYLKESLHALSKKGVEGKVEKKLTPLSLSQVLTVFYLMLLLQAVNLFVFVLEVIPFYCFNKKLFH